MDKYTKAILTVIAVGIIGLNVQMMNGGGFITKANAINMDLTKVQICDVSGCAKVGLDKTLNVSVED